MVTVKRREEIVSRRAERTLTATQRAVWNAIAVNLPSNADGATVAYWRAGMDAIERGENPYLTDGGRRGPLPDGTVIEVKPVGPIVLLNAVVEARGPVLASSGGKWRRGDIPEIVTLYNETQEVGR